MTGEEKMFRGVSLKRELVNDVEEWVKANPEAGYKSVADFIQEATRLRIQEIKKLYASSPPKKKQ